MNFYERFQIDKSLADRIGFNPYYKEIQSGLDNPIIIDGKEYINLASNNYLGLATDKRVKTAMMEAVDKYGASLCGTPIATGYADVYRRVENKFSKFIGLEDTVILPSCYQANTGLFSMLAGKEDLIVVDRYAHSSLIQGIKAVGCKIKPFLHNDMEHLNSILKSAANYRQIFVVTESVFSTDGGIAPLKEIAELCEKYNALPVVDDSHGIGAIGKTGRGILEQQGVKNFQGIYTASLGKALANLGGVISGKKGLIEYLRYYCSYLVYSTALPPVVLAGVEKVLDIIEDEFGILSSRMWSYREAIREKLVKEGFKITNSEAPITSIAAGSTENTVYLAKKFYEESILTTPFIEPSVPVGEGRLRLIAAANLSDESISSVLDSIGRIGKAL